MRAGISIEVSAADRERLERIVADRNSPQKHVWRARIILATAAGCGTAEIMRRAEVSKPCVWRWQERFMREGVAGLVRDKTRKPGLPPLPPVAVERVVALTLGEPPGETTHWTGRAMAAVSGVSLRSVQRIWAAHGLQPHRVRRFKLSTDPAFAAKLRDVVGLYLDPPAHSLVLSVDEKSQIQALDRTQPGLPISDYRRLLKHFPFGRQSIADVSARDILQKLAKLPPSEKHHAFTAARRFFRYAVQQHIIERSPMESMAPPAAGASRERVLSPDELRAIYTTARAGDAAFHRITTLLVLTGQRRTEIAYLERGWIEHDLVTLPSWLTKNKRIHTFPIGKEAQAVIAELPILEGVSYLFPADRKRSDNTTVFNGWGKPKARFDEECGVKGWQLRDLRRTMSTYMAELQIPQVHVEKLLNHVSGGTQSPIAQVYNRYSYLEEMREAVLKWEAYLGTLLTAR